MAVTYGENKEVGGRDQWALLFFSPEIICLTFSEFAVNLQEY